MIAPTTWLGLLFLWILFFWLYRDYRLDYFRQQLFALRDELFNMADNEQIPFDSTAYSMLRSMINGTIQYGHRCGVLDVLCFSICTRGDEKSDELVAQFNQRWATACDEFDAPTRKQLRRIRTQVHLLIAEQVVFTSFILCVSLLAVLFWIALTVLKDATLRRLSRLLSTNSADRFMSRLDYSAALHAS